MQKEQCHVQKRDVASGLGSRVRDPTLPPSVLVKRSSPSPEMSEEEDSEGGEEEKDDDHGLEIEVQ